MRMKWVKLLGTAVLAVAAACSQESEDQSRVEPDETVFDPMIEVMDRAKQVEETHLNRVQELNRTLDTLEGAAERQRDDDEP